MNKKIIIFILLIGLIQHIFLQANENQSRNEEELTCEIHQNSELWVRLCITFNSLTLFFINETKTIEESNLILGISTRHISFGPMYKYGLFAEINNPLGYSPQSAIYLENSELRLKKTFNSGPKRFLNLILIPGVLDLFFQTGEDVPFFYGTKVSATAGDSVKTDILLSISRPLQQATEDSWFSPKHQFPEGTLYHISMKNRVQTQDLDVSISGSVSAGDMIMPGFFIHSYISKSIAWVTLSSIFGYCSKYYVTPEGSSKERMIRSGCSVQFSPAPWLSGEIWYYIDIDHPCPIPRDHLFTSNNLGGKLKVTHSIGKEDQIDLMLHEKSYISFDEQNKKEETHELSFALGYASPNIEMDSAVSLSIDEKAVWGTKITTGFEFYKESHSFSLQNILYIKEDMSWNGKLEYRFHKDKVDVWGSFSEKKPLLLTQKGFQLFTDNPFQFICFSIGLKVVH